MMRMNWRSTLIMLLLPFLVVGQYNVSCTKLIARDSTARITELRPVDVKIIMAMGGSVSAGFGMEGTGIENTWVESRGRSFSGGGDDGVLTVPNLFKYFNPAITGSSTGSRSSEVCFGAGCPTQIYYTDTDGTNAAKPGAMLIDIVSSQIDYLIRQVNQRPDMDVMHDWKVLTIMVGTNDLCASCTFNQTYATPDDYEGNLMGTLERIRTSLPRTFVNLITSPNMSKVLDLSVRSPQCFNVTRKLFISCECLFDIDGADTRQRMDVLTTQFNERAAKVAAYYQRKAYEDFAVVVQPFFSQTDLSRLPPTYLSSVDCFHPSKLAHQAMATALWNNMITPAASKKKSLSMLDTVSCPTEDTLLYTF